MQVREQEKEFARANRQVYEARLSQKRKMLYIELLQKWDREHQQELQELQDAHQRALHAASAAQVFCHYCPPWILDLSHPSKNVVWSSDSILVNVRGPKAGQIALTQAGMKEDCCGHLGTS